MSMPRTHISKLFMLLTIILSAYGLWGGTGFPQTQGNEVPDQIQERGIPLPTDKILNLLPDVTASIKQDWMDNFHFQYKAKIRVLNRGGLSMPAVQIQTLGMRYNPVSTPPNPEQCFPQNNCTIKDHRTIGPLGPGEAKNYHVGSKFTAAETVIIQVKIFCNPPNDCRESDIQNNQILKVLGPH